MSVRKVEVMLSTELTGLSANRASVRQPKSTILLSRTPRRRQVQRALAVLAVVLAEISVLPRISSYIFPDPSTICPTHVPSPTGGSAINVPEFSAVLHNLLSPSLPPTVRNCKVRACQFSVFVFGSSFADVSGLSTTGTSSAIQCTIHLSSPHLHKSRPPTGLGVSIHSSQICLTNVSAEVSSASRGEVPRALNHQCRLWPGRRYAYDCVSPHSATIVCAASRTHPSLGISDASHSSTIEGRSSSAPMSCLRTP